MNIIFADDDPDFIVLFKDAFAVACGSAKISLNTFLDGNLVIEFLRNNERLQHCLPQVIFLDLNMPAPDGIATLAAIRNEVKWNSIHVVMLTSSHDEHDKTIALQHGANGYFEKPVSFESWVKIIADSLGKSRSEQNHTGV